MSSWTESTGCLSRQHCVACRKAEAWREAVGAPVECPFGVTLASAKGAHDEISNTGAGSYLHSILKRLHIYPKGNCKCIQHVMEMNRRGPDWCEKNQDTIIGWLKEEADSRGLPFIKTAALIAVRTAIGLERARLAKGAATAVTL